MTKRVNELLTGIPMTLISGLCLLISLVLMLRGIPVALDPAWLAVLISGLPMLYLALRRLWHNPGISKISSALLIAIAMIAAAAIGDVFAAGEIAFIMAIGGILEDKTAQRSRRGLQSLISLTPKQGRLVKDGREQMILAQQIRVGDILRVLPGETLPVDGLIISGHTSIDQAAITGESLPVDKGEGDPVYSGTINRFGAVDIQATKLGEDSSLQQLIRMVREAESRQAPIQRIADRWAIWLVPLALVIALITYLVTRDLTRGVTVLVVFCPCALVLATPTAIMAAIGQATRHGVIIKSGEALESMGKVDCIAFDKTGTLTEGRLALSDVISFSPDVEESQLLLIAASTESRSEHPIGKAILAAARQDGLDVPEPDSFAMAPGKGIAAVVGGQRVLCGSEAYLAEQGISISQLAHERLESLRQEGKASVLVAADHQLLGLVALADRLRPEAAHIIGQLVAMGVDTVLLTGDNQRTANYFARQAGITSVQASLLPEEKVASISRLQQAGRTVAMMGDGVNDAPALKTASVGIAMGVMGSDIAVEAADIALMSDDMSRLPYLRRLSNATVSTIRFGIFLALFINVAAILLSFKGWLNPTTGALVHNAGSIIVVLIAAMLYDRRFE